MDKVRYTVEDDVVKEIHKVVVHRFNISDTDDPEIYAAEPIWKWQQSESGKFIMENAVDIPVFHKHLNSLSYGYEYAITAELEAKKLSEFYLRWGSIK